MAESLRGHCLIAGKHLRDPNFYKTVVLIVEHGEEGAMGLVVNRPSSVTVSHVLSGHFDLPETKDVVYVGGPVEPSTPFILHNATELEDESTLIQGLYLGNSAAAFEAVVRNASQGTPGLRFRIFYGCAGWAPGQLEQELARGDWYTHPACCQSIFHDDPYQVWDVMLQKFHESKRLLPHTAKNPELN